MTTHIKEITKPGSETTSPLLTLTDRTATRKELQEIAEKLTGRFTFNPDRIVLASLSDTDVATFLRIRQGLNIHGISLWETTMESHKLQIPDGKELSILDDNGIEMLLVQRE